jgi:uncharacterized protein (TIGR01777 family)
MKIIITGATGFIGRNLCQKFVKDKHTVIAVSRNPANARSVLGESVEAVKWDGQTAEGWGTFVEAADAIINLAGENLVSARWTKKLRKKILQSRSDAGRAVVEAINLVKRKPKVLIQSSAIGYYGSRENEILDEESSLGSGFMADVVDQWERSTEDVESVGVRRVVMRIGLVLDRHGGILSRQLLQFRLFVGGSLGNGRQWFSWIHMNDLIRAIQFFIVRKETHGIFNLVAPESLTFKEFCRTLAEEMKRPSWLPVPKLILRIIFAEMADEVLLASQRVISKRLKEAEFQFRFPTVQSAISDILK